MNSKIGKSPTLSSGTSFETKTRNLHQLKSKMNLSSKDNESILLSQYTESSWVSAEEDYTVPIHTKPTKTELDNIGNSQKKHYCKTGW